MVLEKIVEVSVKVVKLGVELAENELVNVVGAVDVRMAVDVEGIVEVLPGIVEVLPREAVVSGTDVVVTKSGQFIGSCAFNSLI